MPISMESLPLDENGTVSQTFRVRHRDPGFNEGFGQVWFTDGLSNPITGEPLARIVAAIGTDLDLVPVDADGEPLTPEPAATSETSFDAPGEPITESAERPTGEPAGEEPSPLGCPAVPRVPRPYEPAAPPNPGQALNLPDGRDALLAVAKARGVDIDGRWGARRIRKAILAMES